MRLSLLLLLLLLLLAAPTVANATSSSDASMVATETGQALGGAVERFGGCALCRNSGNCSIAVTNEASGVFCGDLAASREPCCCPYQTECRVSKSSTVCECVSEELDESLYRSKRSRLQAQEATASEDEDSEMSASTEILIHLSAYLALFVIATFVDEWVDCCRDFRRSQRVYNALDKGIARMKDKYKRRRATTSSARSTTLFSDSEDEDVFFDEASDAPLLLGMSPAVRTPDAGMESSLSHSEAAPLEESVV